jgi:hypothetical protein
MSPCTRLFALFGLSAVVRVDTHDTTAAWSNLDDNGTVEGKRR